MKEVNFGRFILILLVINCFSSSLSLQAPSRSRNRRWRRIIKRNLNTEQFFGNSSHPQQTIEKNNVSNTFLESNRPDVNTVWKQHVNPSNNIQNDFSQRRILDSGAFKSLLKDLVFRLDANSKSNGKSLSTGPLNMLFFSRAFKKHERRAGDTSGAGPGRYPRHIKSLTSHHHCSLHGLWLSTVAGAAIELQPEKQQGHVEIHTKIFELPDYPYKPLITSQWSGKGIISQESPTTLTIVFQEHIDGQKENHAEERTSKEWDNNKKLSVEIQLPRTAVFVGQCLVCHGNQLLQGSWVVFPAIQTCGAATTGFSPIINNDLNGNQQSGSIPSNTQNSNMEDSIYLLRRY